MAKPAITKRVTKGSALTYAELDTNFQNLTDATIALTAGTGGTQVISDLNGNITLVAGTGITLAGDNTAKSVTITATSGSGTVNSGTQYRLAYYPSTGTTVDDISGVYMSATGDTLYAPGIRGAGDTAIDTIGITSSIAGSNSASVFWANGNTSSQQYTRLIGYYNTSPARIDVGRNRTGTTASNIYLQPGIGGNLILAKSGTDTSVTVTTDSTTDLILNTNNGTNSGSITITNGADQNITIAANGTGVVRLSSDLDLTTGIIGTSTTNSNIEIEPNGTGVVYLNGPIETNTTSGTPVDDATVVTWLKVTVGASDYFLPLYQ